jgi:hypothetical protein
MYREPKLDMILDVAYATTTSKKEVSLMLFEYNVRKILMLKFRSRPERKAIDNHIATL